MSVTLHSNLSHPMHPSHYCGRYRTEKCLNFLIPGVLSFKNNHKPKALVLITEDWESKRLENQELYKSIFFKTYDTPPHIEVIFPQKTALCIGLSTPKLIDSFYKTAAIKFLKKTIDELSPVYDVKYKVISSFEEMQDQIQISRKVNLIWLIGHGSAYTIVFSNISTLTPDYFFHHSHKGQLQEKRQFTNMNALATDAVFVLNSCSTAKDYAFGNMSKTFADYFQRKVFAPSKKCSEFFTEITSLYPFEIKFYFYKFRGHSFFGDHIPTRMDFDSIITMRNLFSFTHDPLFSYEKHRKETDITRVVNPIPLTFYNSPRYCLQPKKNTKSAKRQRLTNIRRKVRPCIKNSYVNTKLIDKILS
jgi:hypothetical protein